MRVNDKKELRELCSFLRGFDNSTIHMPLYFGRSHTGEWLVCYRWYNTKEPYDIMSPALSAWHGAKLGLHGRSILLDEYVSEYEDELNELGKVRESVKSQPYALGHIEGRIDEIEKQEKAVQELRAEFSELLVESLS